MLTRVLLVVGIDQVVNYVGLPVDYVHSTSQEAISTLNKLVKRGDEHAKLCRMIMAYLEVRAPRYWWQEMSTYRMGVESYSSSTMHTITKRPLTFDDFEGYSVLPGTLETLNTLIEDGRWYAAKRILPESFLQTRLMMISYQTLRRIWLQRRNHRLLEWEMFLQDIKDLPLAEELIFVESTTPD